MAEDLHEHILQDVVGIVVVKYHIADVAVKRALVFRKQPAERLVLRLQIEQLPDKFLFVFQNSDLA